MSPYTAICAPVALYLATCWALSAIEEITDENLPPVHAEERVPERGRCKPEDERGYPLAGELSTDDAYGFRCLYLKPRKS